VTCDAHNAESIRTYLAESRQHCVSQGVNNEVIGKLQKIAEFLVLVIGQGALGGGFALLDLPERT
jgi:hypothetical protein